VCHGCQGTSFGAHECNGKGRVESVAIVRHPVHPALADAIPYAVVVVSLEDAPGVNVIGNVVGSAPEDVTIGASLRVVFEELDDPETGDALKIPQWELAG
jgi:hypothetical protein